MLKRKMVAIFMMICMIFVFAGCSKETSSADEGKTNEIKKKGKIVLGTCADYPPYEFHKEINGEDKIVGFDIEIAKAIADELEVELEVKDMKFDGLLAALVADKIDFIIAGMVPTEERAKSVAFTQPYYNAQQRILIRAEDQDKIKSIDDLKGLKIGAQKSTVQEEIAKGIEGAQVKSLSKITDLVLELSNKKLDGIILVKPAATAYAKQNNKLMMKEFSLGKDESVAIAINKKNQDLVEEMNKVLNQLIEKGKIDEFIIEATELSEE